MKAKNENAVNLGRLGGLIGGNARAKSLSAERRSEIASIAAHARWSKANDKEAVETEEEVVAEGETGEVVAC